MANDKQTDDKYKDYPVSMRQLLESGVHFGHQTRRWNPKMDTFIYTARNDIHVIDLQQTVELIKDAYNFVKDVVSKKGVILFVGTKKQAQDAISSEAERCKMPYVNQRWLGGTLTNNVTISNSVKKLKRYEEDQKIGIFDQLSKKEASRKTKKLARLRHYLGGIKDMRYLPKAIFIVDTTKEELAIKAKALELREEEKLGRERKIELQKFIRLEQAELRKERAEKQRKFLEQIALEKKIEQFRKREALEIKNLEKYVLSQQRESYEEVQQRIERIKEKYRSLREQKVNEAIRERVAQLGIKIEDTDNKETLLEKERIYNQEREKIEYALESFYRSAHSLCFQINKRYIPKYLSIMRVVDRRFETGEIFIKWDDTAEDDWLILIYIKDNSPDEGIIIEDKSNPEKHNSYEFKPTEIFRASDLMVDSLTKLLDRERNKKKVS